MAVWGGLTNSCEKNSVWVVLNLRYLLIEVEMSKGDQKILKFGTQWSWLEIQNLVAMSISMDLKPSD